MIAPHFGVGEFRSALFGQPVGLVDRGVHVDRERSVAWPGAAMFSVNSADAPGFDAKHFDVATATGTLARVAGAQASFTR